MHTHFNKCEWRITKKMHMLSPNPLLKGNYC